MTGPISHAADGSCLDQPKVGEFAGMNGPEQQRHSRDHQDSVHEDCVQKPAVIPLGTGPVLVGTMPGQPARGGVPASSRPIDPDAVDDGAELDAALTARLAYLLTPIPVAGSLRLLAADPARALGAVASSVGATMIVVGTRERGISARLEDILTGSVAVHLTHRQECPVLVIPLGPLRAGSDGGQRR